MVRKKVLTKEALLGRLNELCVRHKVLRYGSSEAEIHRRIKAMKGKDDYDYCPYFDENEVVEDNGLAFKVTTTADTARDRNRLVNIFKTVAKEWRVAWRGKRCKLNVTVEDGIPECGIGQYWSFEWYFEPNE